MENQTGTTESTPTGDAATEDGEGQDLVTSSAGSSEGRSSGFDSAAADAAMKPTLGSPKGAPKAEAAAPKAPTQAEKRKYQLKVDGQDIEEELSDDERSAASKFCFFEEVWNRDTLGTW